MRAIVRFDRTFDRAIVVVAALVGTLMTWRTLSGIDPFFDTFAYHLPFAARLAGLCPETCYRMHPVLEARFEGFPKLYHFLQGFAWRWSGTPVAGHALTLAIFGSFALYLRRGFDVPVALTLIGLLAVPLIQIHASASYIDLPLNLLVAVAALAIMDLMRDSVIGWRRPFLVVGCLAVAANSKLTMIPLAGALWLWWLALMALKGQAGKDPERPCRRWSRLTGIALLSAVVVFAAAWRNLLIFGNPLYPLQVELPLLTLAGPEVAMQPGWDSLAEGWRDVPSPVRWLASVLEVGGYQDRPLPWTYDQGSCVTAPLLEPCLLSSAPSFRMGGYFVAYVLFLLIFLAFRLRYLNPAARRAVAATFTLVTLLAAFFPHSHELRYVMFWIIALVAMALVCTFSPAFAPGGGSGVRRVLASGMLAAFASVALLTSGHYLVPAGRSVEGLILELGIDDRVNGIDDGTVACVDSEWQPFTFLFAPLFHPGRTYSVLDGPIGPCTTTIGPPTAPVGG